MNADAEKSIGRAAEAGRLGIAVIGAGVRGSRLARTLQESRDWNLAAICDPDAMRAAELSRKLGGAPHFGTIDEALDCVPLDTVAVATPLRFVHGTAMTALRAGKHALVERPLADSLERGLELVAEAQSNSVVLMANHAHSFTPAVQHLRTLTLSGSLGELLFVDVVRTGTLPDPAQRDVFWDLAPESLAILDRVLPEGLNSREVSAFGGDPLGTGRDCVGHVNFRLGNDALAHLYVNRLSCVIRHQVVIAGSRLTVLWDGMRPGNQLSVVASKPGWDTGTLPGHWRESRQPWNTESFPAAIHGQETHLVAEFARRIREADGLASPDASALRVLAMLDAVAVSCSREGMASPVQPPVAAGKAVKP
ncbi:Gfo/Idh/MocA family protein [Pseudarthrobacter sp. NPDC058362]|uniref:Gfo/Idh/MocA family protein n=1 Tax=Pseudarthrobacter sp. NPDC058362 TaxID=3346458 RepID=UPI00364C3244